MKQYLKSVSTLFCIIFTTLILIHYFRGEELTKDVVLGFIGISIFSSGMTFLLRENEKWTTQQVIMYQILYIILIMVGIVFLTYYSGWEFSIGILCINLMIVIILFIIIKYWIFNNDKKEAALLNTALKERRQPYI